MTLVVGANAGGGYDTWARLIARYLGNHLPGTPNVIVQNMNISKVTASSGDGDAVHVQDLGADLNAYMNVEGQSGCCSRRR